MLSRVGGLSLALCIARKSHRTIAPHALKNPRPAGAESTLTENAASPFHAEPRHHCQIESVGIAHVLAVVVAKGLLIEVTEKMERFDTNIRARDAALEKTPEVLKPVRMNSTVNILDSMINNLVSVVCGES